MLSFHGPLLILWEPSTLLPEAQPMRFIALTVPLDGIFAHPLDFQNPSCRHWIEAFG